MESAQRISEIVSEYVPIIPIGYKTEYVFISREYGISNVITTETDPFYNVFKWNELSPHFADKRG